jgi:hypothetical protein
MAEPTILGALRDPQFRRQIWQGAMDAAYRGGIGNLVGFPVDMASAVMRPMGYAVEKPVGGSAWLGDQMQRIGLVSEARNPQAEFMASVLFANPRALGESAFKIEQGLLRAMQR